MNSDLVFALAVAFTNGAVLSANNITAGNGIVIDWNTVKSGEPVIQGADAYDVAVTFVNLAGHGAAGYALDGAEAA